MRAMPPAPFYERSRGQCARPLRPPRLEARELLPVPFPRDCVREHVSVAGDARGDGFPEPPLGEEMSFDRARARRGPALRRDALERPRDVAHVVDVAVQVDVGVADVEVPRRRAGRRRGEPGSEGRERLDARAQRRLEHCVGAHRAACGDVEHEPGGRRARDLLAAAADGELARDEQPLDARRPRLDLQLVPEARRRGHLDALTGQHPREAAGLEDLDAAAERPRVLAGNLLEVPGERGERERAERVHRIAVDREADREVRHPGITPSYTGPNGALGR